MRNWIGTIVGRKGSGKSELLRKVIRSVRRVVILDYLGEYGDEVDAEITYGRADAVRALVELEREKNFVLSCRELDLEETLDVLYVARHLRRAWIMVEEASWICSPNSMPEEVAWLVRYGRHQELSQIYVAQRPAMLHLDIRSQSDLVVSFEQNADRDVEALRDYLGDDADRVRTLPAYHVVCGPERGLARAPRPIVELARQGGRKIPLTPENSGRPMPRVDAEEAPPAEATRETPDGA